MKVDSVPSVLSRAQVAAWLEQIGVDVKDVPLGATLQLGPKAISISVFARNAEGNRYAAPDGQSVAMHHISIPLEGA